MHLTRQSRNLVSSFCRISVFHHLIVEFDCDEQCVEDNILDTAQFYQNLDKNQDWLQTFKEKNQAMAHKYEKCSPVEGPLISVNNSENPMFHSVTARGVQGLLQTSILGVLASPVIRKRTFYFSRHGESIFNVVGRIGGDSDLSPRGKIYAESLARQFGGPGSKADSMKPRLVSYGKDFIDMKR